MNWKTISSMREDYLSFCFLCVLRQNLKYKNNKRERELVFSASLTCTLIYFFPLAALLTVLKLHIVSSSISLFLSQSFQELFNLGRELENQKKEKKKMSLEAVSSNELLNFIIYDTISVNPPSSCQQNSSESTFLLDKYLKLHQQGFDGSSETSLVTMSRKRRAVAAAEPDNNGVVGSGGGGGGCGVSTRKMINSAAAATTTTRQQSGKKKRKRKPKVCKNEEEAETQRMTHIAVERNRRKQMNEHLAVLRSLMPESYVQRGDQASIVGGAVEFLKELEHLLTRLEAKKLEYVQQAEVEEQNQDSSVAMPMMKRKLLSSPPFAQILMLNPQQSWSQFSKKYTTKSKVCSSDIEVTLIETHANLRILSRRSHRQLLKLVAGFQASHLTILHLNVTTIDPLVLYSISAKVEEGCQLRTVDDLAAAVHHMLRVIEEEGILC